MRLLTTLLFLAVFAAPIVGDDSGQLLTIDHFVRVKSTVPAIAGQQAQLYVRERVLAGMVARGTTPSDRVVLFVHGAGTPAEVAVPTTVVATRRAEPAPIRAEIAPLNHVEAAQALRPLVARVGGTWSAEYYQRTVARWPDGVPYDQVDAWAAELVAPVRGGLRVVGGAA